MLSNAIYFPQSIDLNFKLIQKQFYRNKKDNIWPNIWTPHGIVNLTYKMNNHTNNHYDKNSNEEEREISLIW